MSATVKILICASAVIALAGEPSLVAAQRVMKCVAGQEVTDKEGKTGIIVADDDKLCQVKYANGQIYNWIFWNLRPTAAHTKSGLVTPQAASPGPSNESPRALTVLRPSSNRSFVYDADWRGHFILAVARQFGLLSILVQVSSPSRSRTRRLPGLTAASCCSTGSRAPPMARCVSRPSLCAKSESDSFQSKMCQPQ
jgi:hypothetical protein